jgi:hypothetical protein
VTFSTECSCSFFWLLVVEEEPPLIGIVLS